TVKLEPSLEQIDLCRFSRSIQAFDGDELSRNNRFLWYFRHQLARSSTTTVASKAVSNRSRLAARAHFSSNISPLPFRRSQNLRRLYSTSTLSTVEACSWSSASASRRMAASFEMMSRCFGARSSKGLCWIFGGDLR